MIAPPRRALITGITGQDGSYLAELLLGKGYEVHGIVRRSSSLNTARIDHLFRDAHLPGTRLFLHFGDLTDSLSLCRILTETRPDEIYNLGAQSHVRVSFDVPIFTADTGALGTLRLLEAIKDVGLINSVRYYQAGSSEMFGSSPPPQSEATPFHPRSPYACAKVFSHYATINYRESYGLHASNGILFNHESPRRGATFVTQKVVQAAVRIRRGNQNVLYLGNLDAMRDWGFAGDYVRAVWLMLQQPTPDDYVIATGKMYSVRDLLDVAFEKQGLDWKKYVRIDPHYFRPAEVEALRGDPTKAMTKLGWKPEVDFRELISMMLLAAEAEIPWLPAGPVLPAIKVDPSCPAVHRFR